MSAVRDVIPGYAGHGDAPARRLADQQLRAWAGERLAALRERVPAAGATPAFDDLLFDCEFGDQRVIAALERSRFGEPDAVAAIERADEAVIAAVAPAPTVDPASAPALVGAVAAAMHARTAAILALEG